MATAPSISEANLSPGGGLVLVPASKKPVYAVRQLTVSRQSTRLLYRPAGSPVRQPKHLLFGALSHPRLRLLKPIPVEISSRKGTYFARFKAADEFGTGSTPSLALEDLGKTLAELFIGLTERQSALGSGLKKLLDHLSHFVAYR